MASIGMSGMPLVDFFAASLCGIAIFFVSLEVENCCSSVGEALEVPFVLSIGPRPVSSQSGLMSSYANRIFSILDELRPLPPFLALPKSPTDRPAAIVI